MAKIRYPIVDGHKECSSCHRLLPRDQFLFIKRKGCYETRCRACRSEYWREYRKLHPPNLDKAREQQRNKCRSTKQGAVDYKGGRCQFCGYSRYIGALDFHHRDPRQKDPRLRGTNRGMTHFIPDTPELRAELDKCILRCATCHREIHAGILEIAETGKIGCKAAED